MVTTKEFKQLHSLSDSAFDRLRARIKAEHSEAPLTRRVNDRDWEIVDISLFEQYLPAHRSKASTEASIVPVELVDDAPAPIIPFTNGFKAVSALTFETTSSAEISAHILEEVQDSGNNVKESLQDYFTAMLQQDREFGRYLGTRRLQEVLGTADAVFTHGLGQHAKSQGLGKKQESDDS